MVAGWVSIDSSLSLCHGKWKLTDFYRLLPQKNHHGIHSTPSQYWIIQIRSIWNPSIIFWCSLMGFHFFKLTSKLKSVGSTEFLPIILTRSWFFGDIIYGNPIFQVKSVGQENYWRDTTPDMLEGHVRVDTFTYTVLLLFQVSGDTWWWC